MIITISNRVDRKIEQFAEAVTKTTYSNYCRRGQFDYEKQIEDHKRGKVAEFGVWAYLKKLGITLPAPDLGVYTTGKTHGADLGTDIHIKTVASRRTESWVYQRNCPHLYTGVHIYTVTRGRAVEVLYMITGKNLTGQYYDLLSDHLNRTKQAIYGYNMMYRDSADFIYKKGEQDFDLAGFKKETKWTDTQKIG